MRHFGTAVMVLSLSLPALAQPAPPRVSRAVDVSKEVVVVVNDNVPDSVAVGMYYASKRGIPSAQICHLSTQAAVPTGQMQSNGELVEWPLARTSILDPLKSFLASRPQVIYIVPTYGIPIRIVDPVNDPAGDTVAAVDQEIAMLQIEHPLSGYVDSPVRGLQRHVAASDRYYIVSRIDGPTPQDAYALVDNALRGEAEGIRGTSLLDRIGPQSDRFPVPYPGSVYADYDSRMAGLGDLWATHGIAYDEEQTDSVVVLTSRPDQAHYWGWYDFDTLWPDPSWRFAPGAVGFHTNSWSAHIFHSRDNYWAGPLVHHGITGTCGAVAEPYLTGHTDGLLFFERFMTGYTFGEAMTMATPSASWAMLFIGDPLYAPYAANVAGSGNSDGGITGGGGDVAGPGGDGTGGGSGGGCAAGIHPGAWLAILAGLPLLKFRR